MLQMKGVKILSLVAVAMVVSTLSGAVCNRPDASFIPPADEASGAVFASGDYNHTKYITGIVIDSKGYLVIAPFRVIVKNLDKDQFKDGGTFDDGSFNVSFVAPSSFAEENDTLSIEITSTDGRVQYGNTTLLLSNLNATTTYEVEVFIPSPPQSYSWLWVIVFVLAFGLILAGYAIFTRWVIGKIVLRRANQIMLEEWRRKGGGQMRR